MTGQLLLGAHMSIAGGLHRAFGHGVAAGCSTIQIFLKNSNQWRARTISEADRLRFVAAQDSSGIRPVLAHTSYLINLASPDRNLYEKSLRAFVQEMERASFLGVPFRVLHPGAHLGSGEDAGLSRVTRALNRALESVPPPLVILVENTAGQGSSLGYRFEHLAAIQEGIRDPDRIGFCLDTCHLFSAGYDISTVSGYRKTMRAFARLVGTERIHAFHLNDCKRELGSRIDRHEHIGHGTIGLTAFRCLLEDPRFWGIPKILETPKGKDLKEDIMNLTTLRLLGSGSDPEKSFKIK